VFRKELIKTLVLTKATEKEEFKKWLLKNFGNTHEYLINKVFEVVKT